MHAKTALHESRLQKFKTTKLAETFSTTTLAVSESAKDEPERFNRVLREALISVNIPRITKL